jgi:S1-C subfamily serine protease
VRQNNPFPSPSSHAPPEPRKPLSRYEILQRRLKRFLARFRAVFLVLIAVIITFGSVLIYDSTKPPPQHLTQRDIDAAVEKALETAPPKPSFESQAYEVIRPSLVSIFASGLNSDNETEASLGAGVVVDDTGIVLTCLHVIDNASTIMVVFADGSESEATAVVKQPENDLAVLRPEIVPDDLVPATLASSTEIQIGDEVVAVGNPFGMRDSVSSGVVSGLGRSFKSPETGQTLTNLIQFDAAVNPGNSGGPLLNRDGEVVGIVTALLNPTNEDVFIGIGFAITIETAGAAAGAPPV